MKATKLGLLKSFKKEYKKAKDSDHQLRRALDLTQEYGDQTSSQLSKLLGITKEAGECLNNVIDSFDGDVKYSSDMFVQKVIDKYMNMETDLFDSDDLNEIIDEIEK